jgi:hypothetical protein
MTERNDCRGGFDYEDLSKEALVRLVPRPSRSWPSRRGPAPWSSARRRSSMTAPSEAGALAVGLQASFSVSEQGELTVLQPDPPEHPCATLELAVRYRSTHALSTEED